MAIKKKAAKKKATAKPAPGGSAKPAKKQPPKKKKSEESESIENFQNTKLTGRASGNGQVTEVTEEAQAAEPGEAAVTMAVNITGVKINKKDELIITVIKIESDGSTTESPETHKGRTAHADLKAAFTALRPHLALLCEYLSTQQIKDVENYSEEHVEKFVVRAVSMNGEGYVISGHKIRKDGKAIQLNTPYQLIEQDEKTQYRYMTDLEAKVAELLVEVKLYQTGEKVGEAVKPPEKKEKYKQPALPFDGAEENNGEVKSEVEEEATAGGAEEEEHNEFDEEE